MHVTKKFSTILCVRFLPPCWLDCKKQWWLNLQSCTHYCTVHCYTLITKLKLKSYTHYCTMYYFTLLTKLNLQSCTHYCTVNCVIQYCSLLSQFILSSLVSTLMSTLPCSIVLFFRFILISVLSTIMFSSTVLYWQNSVCPVLVSTVLSTVLYSSVPYWCGSICRVVHGSMRVVMTHFWR